MRRRTADGVADGMPDSHAGDPTVVDLQRRVAGAGKSSDGRVATGENDDQWLRGGEESGSRSQRVAENGTPGHWPKKQKEDGKKGGGNGDEPSNR
jgi:hypothetical protein